MEFITWLSQSFGSGHLRADLLGATAIVSGCLFIIYFLTWSAIGRRFETISGSDAQRMSASLDTLQIELKTLAQSFAFEAIKIRQDIQFIGSRATWKRDEAA
jgi:hypothetical protein